MPACAAGTDLLYVISATSDIYTFDPPSKQFAKVATANCANNNTPLSMAIDRHLVAWLVYSDGLYTFDLKTKGPCQTTGISVPASDVPTLTFATDVAGGPAETLYLANLTGLARVDMGTKTIVNISKFSPDPNLSGTPWLVGTGQATLYGFFPTYPNVRVAQIDKATAKILSDSQVMGLPQPSGGAAAFWGGDFYFFFSNPGGVLVYSPSPNPAATQYATTTISITGAAASTCASL